MTMAIGEVILISMQKPTSKYEAKKKKETDWACSKKYFASKRYIYIREKSLEKRKS